MSNYGLLYRYLHALEISLVESKRKVAFNEMLQFLTALTQSEIYKDVFLKQSYSFEQKKSVFFPLLKKIKAKEVKQFFDLFLSKDRFSLFQSLNQLVLRFSKKFDDEIEAILETPLKLNRSEETILLKQLPIKTKQKIVFNQQINPELLGGVKVKIGNTVYDASIASCLANFKSSLSEINLNTGEMT